MPVTFDRSAMPGVIRLEGEIDIASGARLKAVLMEALETASGARISLEAATGVDVTAVQLLWAAERGAKATGVALTLDRLVPETLRAALRDAGFERFPLDDDFGEEAEAANEVR